MAKFPQRVGVSAIDRFERGGEARINAGTFGTDDESAVDDFKVERRVGSDG